MTGGLRISILGEMTGIQYLVRVVLSFLHLEKARTQKRHIILDFIVNQKNI